MFPAVALDIETTGLDPNRDAIIEIGAVKFDGTQVVDQWQNLINPQRTIPQLITQLTGITNQMVASCPPISEVILDIGSFVGGLPVIGHNIVFDLSFLNLQYDFSLNHIHDTFQIATIVLPTASRYSLASLIEEMRIFIENTKLSQTVFRSDHASNYLVLKGILSKDKETLLEKIDYVLNNPQLANLRKEWQRGL